MYTIVVLLLALTTHSNAVFNGMCYVSYASSDMGTNLSDQSFAALAAVGVDTVEIVFTWYQANLTSTVIQPSAYSPTWASIEHAIDTALSLGLDVILKPHVDCLCGSWRGDIGPGFTTKAEWEAWFAAYTAYVVQVAQLSQQKGLNLMNIGTEYVGTTTRTSDWLAVIKAIRAEFDGKLVYGSNWGQETLQIQFWSSLDYIGVDAYYPLASTSSPPMAEIIQNWQPLKAVLQNVSETWGNMSILFTEIGYRSIANAAEDPGDYSVPGPLNVTVQADLYKAVFETVYNSTWFGGVFWWMWGTSPYDGGLCDTNYFPQRKPASSILQQFYGSEIAPLSSPSSAPFVIYSNGNLANGWSSWSYTGTYTQQDGSNPYPQHQYSFGAVMQSYGGLSLDISSMSTQGYESLSFSLICQESSAPLIVYFCTCPNCNTCTLNSMDITEFYEPGNNCVIPSSWSTSLVTVPLNILAASNITFQRITIENNGQTTVSCQVDNIQLQ